MSTITYKYTIYLPDHSGHFYTADTSKITADSSVRVDRTYSVHYFQTVTIPQLGFTVDSMDVTVDDTTITVDYAGILTPVTRYRIYLPYTIGMSFTADSTITADSSITADTTLL